MSRHFGSHQPSWYYVLPSMALLLAVGLHWAAPPTTVAQIDLFSPYDAANMLAKCAASWNHFHAFVGSVDNCFSWTPYFAVLALLERLFGTSFAQALIFALPVLFSWLGAFKCARVLGASPPAACVAAWLYAFNPARQSMFGMFVTGEVCAALLPWIFYWVMLAALSPERRRYVSAMLTAATFLLLVILANTPQLLVSLLIGTVIWLALASTLTTDRSGFWKWVGSTALLVGVASLWWVLPNVVSYTGVAILHSTDPLAVAWSFYRASLLNELRFCAAWIWQFPEYNPWAVEFDNNAFLYASGFVPVAGLAVALAVTRGYQAAIVRFAALFALVMLFIAKGTHPPLEVLNHAFYRIPGMFLFIEPYGAILLAALAMALAGGLAAAAIIDRLRARARIFVTFAVVTTSVLAVLWNNLAALTGAIFHEQTNILPNAHIHVSSAWRELAQRLNGDQRPGGVVILPPDDFYQVDYDWGFHGVDWIPIQLLHRDVLMPGVPFDYKQTPESRGVNFQVASAIAARSPHTAEFLRDIGVRFVVARNDVRLQHAFRPVPLELERLFGPPLKIYGPLELYDLGAIYAPVRLVHDGEVSRPRTRNALQPATVVRVYSYRAFRSNRSGLALPVLTLVGRTMTTSTNVVYDVVNPAPRPVACDVSVGVWPRFNTPYELRTDDGQHRSVSVKAKPATVWLRFVHVVLRPGQSHFAVSAPPSPARSFAAFFPPRFFEAQRSTPLVNQVMFSNVERATGNDVPAAVDSSAGSPRLASPSLDLSYSAAEDPSVTVQPEAGAAPGSTGWFIDAVVRGVPYRCFAVYLDSTQYKLDDTIRSCMYGLGRELTQHDAPHIRITQLTLTQRYAGERIESLRLEAQRLAPAPLEAKARVDGLRTEQLPLALGEIVNIAAARPVDFATSEAFSPTWVAIVTAGHAAVLRHERADGWRNAWRSRGPGKVYVVNWLVGLQMTLIVLGVFAVLLAGRRR